MTLLEFVSYLAGKGMIDHSKLHDDTDEGLAARLATQKYAYLAKYFGLDLGYRPEMDLYGPYSTRLTQDCLDMDLEKVAPVPAPPGLHEKEFLSVVSGRSPDWLEVATTYMVHKEFRGDTTLEQLISMKPDHTPELIRAVHGDVHRLILPPVQVA